MTGSNGKIVRTAFTLVNVTDTIRATTVKTVQASDWCVKERIMARFSDIFGGGSPDNASVYTGVLAPAATNNPWGIFQQTHKIRGILARRQRRLEDVLAAGEICRR